VGRLVLLYLESRSIFQRRSSPSGGGKKEKREEMKAGQNLLVMALEEKKEMRRDRACTLLSVWRASSRRGKERKVGERFHPAWPERKVFLSRKKRGVRKVAFPSLFLRKEKEGGGEVDNRRS